MGSPQNYKSGIEAAIAKPGDGLTVEEQLDVLSSVKKTIDKRVSELESQLDTEEAPDEEED